MCIRDSFYADRFAFLLFARILLGGGLLVWVGQVLLLLSLIHISPAHDVNDYMLGEKYNLPAINIFNDNGTLSEAAGLYVGRAISAKCCILRNHCMESFGSIATLVRSEKPTLLVSVSYTHLDVYKRQM